MSSVYERLLNLFSVMGLSTEQGSRSEAEVYALSSGAELITGALEEMKARMFFSLYGAENVEYYARMLSLDSEHAEGEALLASVLVRSAANYGECPVFSELSNVAEGVSVEDNTVTLSDLKPYGVYYAGAFAAGCVPFFEVLSLGAGGMKFSQWDSLGRSFRQFDSLKLPFSCIDTLSTAYFD